MFKFSHILSITFVCFVTRYSFLGSLKAWLMNNDRKEEVDDFLHDGIVLLFTAPIILLLSYSGISITDHILNGELSVNINYNLKSII